MSKTKEVTKPFVKAKNSDQETVDEKQKAVDARKALIKALCTKSFDELHTKRKALATKRERIYQSLLAIDIDLSNLGKAIEAKDYQ